MRSSTESPKSTPQLWVSMLSWLAGTMPIVLVFGPMYVDALQGPFLTSRSSYGVGVFLTMCMLGLGCAAYALCLHLNDRRATVILGVLAGFGFSVLLLVVTFGLALFLPSVLIDFSVTRTSTVANVLRLMVLVVALFAGAIASVLSQPKT